MADILIDTLIVAGYMGALNANTYVVANAVPIEKFHDDSDDMTLPCITVQCDAPVEYDGTAGLWTARVSIKSRTKPEDDKDTAILEAMNNAVRGLVKGTNMDSLYTYAGTPAGVGFHRAWKIEGEKTFSIDGSQNIYDLSFEVILESGL